MNDPQPNELPPVSCTCVPGTNCVTPACPIHDAPMSAATEAALARLKSIPASQGPPPDEVAERREKRRRALLEDSQLPARARRVLADPAHAHHGLAVALQSILDTIRQRHGVSMVFHGLAGRGKTVTATAVALDYIARGRSVRYLTLAQLEELYDAARNRPEKEDAENPLEFPSEHAVSQGLGRGGPDLLIIDECGKSRATDYVMRKLFHLGDARYNEDLDTIYIGNLTQPDFEVWLGASLTDRVNENGGFIEFNLPKGLRG